MSNRNIEEAQSRHLRPGSYCQRVTFAVSPQTLAFPVLLLAICLVVLFLLTQYLKYFKGHDYQLGLLQFLDLNGEGNLPSWYSSVMLLFSSVLLAIIGFAKRRDGDRYALHWLALSVIFFYISLDEGAGIHDRLGLRETLRTTGYLYYAWVVPGILVVLLVALSYISFVVNLPAKTRWQIVLAGTLYLGGALGVEMLEGNYEYLHGGENFTYSVLSAVEEGLEMFGVAVFLYALSSYMASNSIQLLVIVTGKE